MPSGILCADIISKAWNIPMLGAVHASDIKVLSDIKYVFFKQRMIEAYKNCKCILPRSFWLKDKIKKLIVDKTVVFAFSSYDIALNFTFENVLLLAYSTIVMTGNIHNKENFTNTLAGYKFVNNKKICSIPISLDNKKIYVEENEFANNLKLKSEIFDKGLLALTTDKISFNNSKQVVISAEIYYINKFNIAYLDINSDIATIYLDHPYKEGDKLTLSFDISDGILYDFESERRIST